MGSSLLLNQIEVVKRPTYAQVVDVVDGGCKGLDRAFSLPVKGWSALKY